MPRGAKGGVEGRALTRSSSSRTRSLDAFAPPPGVEVGSPVAAAFSASSRAIASALAAAVSSLSARIWRLISAFSESGAMSSAAEHEEGERGEGVSAWQEA